MSLSTNDEIREKVKDFVANNKITKAISLLIDHFTQVEDEPRQMAALKLSAQYKRINKKVNLSEMTQEKADVGISKIINAILHIFEEIPLFDDDHDEGIADTKDNFGKRIILISSLLIILFLISGITASIFVQGLDPIKKAVQASLFVVGASMTAFGLLFMVKKYILD